MMTTSVLGSHKQKIVFSCRGILPVTKARRFAKHFIRLAGMTPARKGRIDSYPFNHGGGFGFTGFFPLIESYLMIDVYTDLNETEILLSTCKPEKLDLPKLRRYLSKQIGPIFKEGCL
jgi:S-adenosylmethionine/arginine decarboxylase-like enzyme